MMLHCYDAVPIVLNVDSGETTPGNTHAVFTLRRGGERGARLETPNGDLNFSGTRHHVFVTMHLTDANHVFFKSNDFNVLGFADSFDDGYPALRPVGPGHYQIRHIRLSDDLKTVSFCYTNTHQAGEDGNPDHFRLSRYTLYLRTPGHRLRAPQIWIDPRISNH